MTNKPNDDRYIRVSGDVRVPNNVDEDIFIEAFLGLCQLHGWGFTGGARELTLAELYEDGAESGGEAL